MTTLSVHTSKEEAGPRPNNYSYISARFIRFDISCQYRYSFNSVAIKQQLTGKLVALCFPITLHPRDSRFSALRNMIESIRVADIA